MIDGHNSILVVRRVEVEYALPARLDDLLSVDSRVVDVRGVTMTIDQRVTREGTALAALLVELACVDRTTLRPRRIPDPLRHVLGDTVARGRGVAAASVATDE
jgi:YbgC/YbaW family acyl-CoA thioester hydrolase